MGQAPGPSSSSDHIWSTIREKFLPSKDKQLLEFRYMQLINAAGSEGEKFKKYVKQMKERGKSQPKWTLDEDIDLLKGFQVYGDKWHMIHLYFLPHRPRRELKSRWATLLKESAKTFPNGLGPVRQDGTINSSMTLFLTELKSRGEQTNMNDNERYTKPTDGFPSTKQVDRFLLQQAPNIGSSSMGPPAGADINRRTTWQEADDDVLVDTDTDESPDEDGKHGVGRGDNATGIIYPHSDWLGSSEQSLRHAPQEKYPLQSQWISNRNDFPHTRCSVPSTSQFDYTSYGEDLIMLSSKGTVTPERVDSGHHQSKSAFSPIRVVETSLGAFDCTVPNFTDDAYSNFDSKSKKRPHIENHGDIAESPKFPRFGAVVSKHGASSSENITATNPKGASLFERVMRSPARKKK